MAHTLVGLSAGMCPAVRVHGGVEGLSFLVTCVQLSPLPQLTLDLGILGAGWLGQPPCIRNANTATCSVDLPARISTLVQVEERWNRNLPMLISADSHSISHGSPRVEGV